MRRNSRPHSPERVAIIRWTARIGAVTAEAAAVHHGATVPCARALLTAGEREGLLRRQRPLVGQPALYSATRAGIRAAGVRGLRPCRVSPANARHLIVCARVAAALERCYPDHRVLGEAELRRDQREGVSAATALLGGVGSDERGKLHAPDLVLSREGSDELPVAVEVELTRKAPRRLSEICAAWARCRAVSGVLYLAPAEVARAVERAIESADAGERVVLVPLEVLWCDGQPDAPPQSSVPTDA